MAINPFVQPDYTGQVGAVYKGNIDTSIAALARVAASFMPLAQTVPDLTVRVLAGVLPAAIGSVPVEVAAQNTAALVAPAANPRKDIVYIDAATGAVGVAAGAEAAVPVDPVVPDGKIPIARVNWTVGMAEIVNADLDDVRFGAAGALIERALALDAVKHRQALGIHKKGADIASAATVNLDAATGDLVDVTGNTAITAITLAEGIERAVRFTGTPTLTHGASLVLPSGANIVAAAGDYAVFRGYAAGVVRCTNYERANGKALVSSGASSFAPPINLRVSVAPAGKTCTWAVDDITYATALGGTLYNGGASTFVFDGATTGAGGMDTGAMPTSADVHIYGITKADGTESVIGTTDFTGGEVYGGANMPADYVGSKLIFSGKTDGSGNFVSFTQRGRRVAIARVQVLNITSSVPTGFTALSLSSCVPANAKFWDGIAGPPANGYMPLSLAATSAGLGHRVYHTPEYATVYEGFYGAAIAFCDMLIAVAQTTYYKAAGAGNPVKIDVNGYEF